MPRLLSWIALAVSLVIAVAGCGGNDNAGDDAGAFVVQVNSDVLEGDFGDAYDSLHPAQKRILGSSERLERCLEGQLPDYPEDAKYVTTKTQVQPWTIPGDGRSSSTAVMVDVREGDRVIDRFTQHVFRVGGKWTWILSGPLVKAARTGAC